MAQLMLVSNPSKRRRKSSSKKKSSKRRAPAKRKASSRRRSRTLKFNRNPIRARGMLQRVVDQQLIPAAKQAGGALVVDVAFGYAGRFIPPQLNTGMLRHVTKAAGAIVLSALAANFVKNSTAAEMAKGSLTCTLRDAAKELLATAMPTLPLGYFSPARVVSVPRLSGGARRALGLYQSRDNVTALPTARSLAGRSGRTRGL